MKDKKYGTSELRAPAVVQLQMDQDAVAPARTTFGELMETLDNVPGISQMARATSRPESNHMRLDSEKPQSNITIPGLAPHM